MSANSYQEIKLSLDFQFQVSEEFAYWSLHFTDLGNPLNSSAQVSSSLIDSMQTQLAYYPSKSLDLLFPTFLGNSFPAYQEFLYYYYCLINVGATVIS